MLLQYEIVEKLVKFILRGKIFKNVKVKFSKMLNKCFVHFLLETKQHWLSVPRDQSLNPDGGEKIYLLFFNSDVMIIVYLRRNS